MNILYISSLPKTESGGPRHSVPKQVFFQSNFDNVYWVNLNEFGINNELIKSDDYKNPKDFSISKLEAPFNNPDLVVFQEVYNLPYCKIAKDFRSLSIPYIIIPRGSLTKGAQARKKLKKKVGNLVLFNKFIKSASCIQYLTQKEYIASTNKWNSNYFILPNGTDEKQEKKLWNNVDKGALKGVFVGRKNVYHKGIDFLVEACIKERQLLLENNIQIYLYGPDRDNAEKYIKEKIEKYKLEKILFIKGEIYKEDKQRMLLNSDFFILTSRFEGHSTGLIEALSYGLPCLVTEGSNMSEEIYSYDAGWTANNNSESVGKAIRTLVENIKNFPKISENSIKLSKKYQWDKLAHKSNEIFTDIIISHSSR